MMTQKLPTHTTVELAYNLQLHTHTIFRRDGSLKIRLHSLELAQHHLEEFHNLRRD